MSTSEKTSKKNRTAKVESTATPTPTDSASSEPSSDASAAAARESARNTQDWIAEVSHELRLPIANIKLLVETLLDGALEDPQTAKRMLSRTKVEVDRLQALVVDLLSVETVSQARDVRCEWVDLKTRANFAIETLNKQAHEKSIELRVNITPKARIFVNAAQLDQVLLNLIENAIKFTPKQGIVTVASGERSGCFTVSDTGIGVPQHEIPKIFQRFYRVDRAQSRGSTGLGLSIVKHIVDLHGAKISVLSKEGAGSSFTLEFPGPKDESMESK